ncbi:amino acid adenylation domain-containing protein, partial [Legionella sainthelensi]
MSATRLLYQLQEYRILLWKNDEGNLAFSVDKSVGFPQELKEQVKNYKTELLFLLEYNDIHSEEQAKYCGFYKIPEQLHKWELQTIQKGMYLQTTLDEQKATYTVPLFVLFKNANPNVLKQAILHLVNKNPILRMHIVDELNYEILPENGLTIHECSISAQQITLVCEQKGRRAFALEDEPLIYLELMAIRDTQHFLVNLTHHHMLSDAYSADLMINELVDQYQKISKGCIEKNERTFHYFDYTCFQDYALHTEPYQHAINQLAQQLDAAEPLNLLARGTLLADNGAGFYEFKLEKHTYKQIQQLALDHEISVYSLLLTGLYQVLSTYSGGQTNFPIALTVSNRLPEMNQVIGPFINTLPLISEYKKEESVLYHAQKIHEAISFLNTYHQINLDVLAQHLKRNHEDLPALLQVLFTFHNFKQVLTPEIAEFAQSIVLPDCYEKFGISIIAKEHDESIYFTVTYFANRYESAYIKRLFNCFTHLLMKYCEGVGLQKISSMHLLDECLWNRIVHQLNHTEVYFPQQKTINQLFEEQVARTPENIAVVYEQNRLTYHVLNNRANQLAHFLRERYALKPDTMVCLCLDRSEHMMISILAVLKAGAAYVPIAPDFPQARIEYLIQDTHTPLLLTNQHHQSWLESFLTLPIHAVDEARFVQQLAKQSCDNLSPQHTSRHLAYVIYTSGTTGQPKGVMLEHRGVVNRIHWMNKQYPLSEQDKIIQKTPYVFDVSVWELLWAHWYGACLVFAKPEGHKDADYLYALMRQEEITRAHFVPSMLHVFMDALKLRLDTIPSLQMIFCSGEALKLAQVKQVHDLLPHTEIHNLYGPTEASIDVLYADCSDKNIVEIVIGKPIDNTTVYVLDEHMNPLPFYALGELYIGGVGLARGYLNRDELTKERFVVNPFQSAEQKRQDYNSRLYKTGDVVSLSPDGEITYHGRNDFQVKIRGHRIELGEIEQALLGCGQVQQ